MRWNNGAHLLAQQLLGLLAVTAGVLLFSQTPIEQPPANPAAPSPPAQPAPPRYLVMIDPAHGGSDAGAALNPAMPEKDVTLVFARRLQAELNHREIPAALLRDGDNTLSVDQRASMVNSAQPALYISLHASSQGNGVVLYTAMLAANGEDLGRFLDWQTAQSGSLVRSHWAEQQITASIQKTGFPLRRLVAALRPLNNLMTLPLC